MLLIIIEMNNLKNWSYVTNLH